MKRLLMSLFLAAILTCLASCGSGNGKHGTKIGFMPKLAGIPYFNGGAQLCHTDSWHYALGAFSTHKKEAAEFIKFISGPVGSKGRRRRSTDRRFSLRAAIRMMSGTRRTPSGPSREMARPAARRTSALSSRSVRLA